MKTARRVPRTAAKAICVEDEIVIPADLTNLDSFRRWIRSRAYPAHGEVLWLAGTIWVGTGGESLDENQAKLELTCTLGTIVKEEDLGEYFTRGVRFTHSGAQLSCEPDGLFFSHETLKKIRIVGGYLGRAVNSTARRTLQLRS